MRRTPVAGRAAWPPEQGTRDVAFYLFCAFLVSYFARLTARSAVLGAMHFDLLLAVLTALAIALGARGPRRGPAPRMDPVARRLWILVGYIVLT
ncbi:MAG: hypothetical protein JOZ03_07960, partial [Gammaproteobacteria bacterium]|nr:hypothetical protein [Gammaproteobacteria bacterium]